MRGKIQLALRMLALVAAGSAVAGEPPPETVFVQDGVPKLVREEGRRWKRAKGYLECGGVNNRLIAGRAVGPGDFHITVKLRLLKLRRSAASFE